MINTEEKNKLSPVEVIRGINWRAVLLCCMSFFMGRVCLFGTFYTLGIAYVGAMFFDKQTRRWSALLAILGLLSTGILDTNSVKYILIMVILSAFRGIMSTFRCEFNLRNQLLLTAISIFLINMMSLFMMNFTLYKLIVGILEIAICMGILSILSVSLKIIYEDKNVILTEYELASMAFYMACLLCGFIDFYVVMPFVEKIYLKDILIFVILLGAIYLGGIGSGTVVSIIISTVLVVIGYIPTSFVAIYVFAALIGGLFCHLERLGIIFSTTLGLLLGFALFNNKVIDVPIMGAFIVASLVSLCIPKNYFGMGNWFGYGYEQDEVHHLKHLQVIITERLKNFSKAFASLGREFENIPLKKTELNVKQMNELIEETGEAMCKDCAMQNFCWCDYIKDTYKSGYKMLETLENKRQIIAGDIPPHFKKSCINAESFAYTLSMKLDVFKQNYKWQKNFEEARGMIAEEFKGISESVKKLYQSIEGNFSFNKEDEGLIKEALQGFGIRTRDIMVLENNGRKEEIHIYCNYKGESDYKEKVIEAAERALELKLEIKKYEYVDEEKYCYFALRVKKQFSLAISAQSQPKQGVCGDSYSFMELTNGKYLMALADGMGSGHLAQQESKMTIELLEDFLEAGFENEVALRIINSALVLKSDVECYATMDMALIDQYTGVIEFLKMGASTSFIVRGDEVILVKASSLPIGILSHVDIVSCKKQLKDGDIVIMVTDGMLENKHDLLDREVTFRHFISEAKSNSPEYMAKFLLDKTKNLLAGEEMDDMTVIVARIWK